MSEITDKLAIATNNGTTLTMGIVLALAGASVLAGGTRGRGSSAILPHQPFSHEEFFARHPTTKGRGPDGDWGSIFYSDAWDDVISWLNRIGRTAKTPKGKLDADVKRLKILIREGLVGRAGGGVPNINDRWANWESWDFRRYGRNEMPELRSDERGDKGKKLFLARHMNQVKGWGLKTTRGSYGRASASRERAALVR